MALIRREFTMADAMHHIIEQHGDRDEAMGDVDETLDADCLRAQRDSVIDMRALHADARTPGTDITLARVSLAYSTWMRWFNALNFEIPFGDWIRISSTDVGFIALCHAWRRREAVSCVGLGDLCTLGAAHAHLVVIACQHTAASRHAWPTRDEWAQLKRQVVHLVTNHFDDGPKALARMRARLEGVQLAPCDSRLVAAYRERFMPDTLVEAIAAKRDARARERESGSYMEKAAQKQRARVAIKMGVELDEDAPDPDADDVSEEASGALWRNSAGELACNFVRNAARIFVKVDCDNFMVARYGCPREATPEMRAAYTPPRFTDQVYDRVAAWVTLKCSTMQTEELMKLFRDTANESWAPMGTDTQRFRSKDTRSDITGALAQLEAELGLNLSQHMHDRSLVRPSELAKSFGRDTTPNGMFGDALLLSLFVFACMQQINLDFATCYVVRHPHRTSEQAHLADTSYGSDRRPIIVLLQRRWQVLHHQRLLPCNSLTHALLAWMHIVRVEYNNMTEEKNHLKQIIDVFLDSSSIQL